MSDLLAIDVGSTATTAALWREGAPVLLSLGEGSDPAPSILYRRAEDGSFVAGPGALVAAAADPAGAVVGFKRRLGETMTVGSARVTGWELAARMVGWVVGVATERHGGPPARILLTCPVSWGRQRRDLLLQAGSLAGVADVTVIGDAAAAANYYAWTTPLDPGAAVAVYDLGGGGFDAAVLVRTSTGFELCAESVGDDHTGGAAFDRAVLDLISAEVPADGPVPDLSERLAVAARVKEALTVQESVDLASWIPGAAPTARLTRARFEQTIRGELAATVDRLRSTLGRAEIDPTMLSAVLLTGSSSRIPLVAELMRARLGVSAQVLDPPKQAVCLGAAIAGRRSGGAAPPGPRATGITARRLPERATMAMDVPLEPAPRHWARTREVPDDPTLVVRLDDVPNRQSGRRLLLRLLLLALATAALVTAAILLADVR